MTTRTIVVLAAVLALAAGCRVFDDAKLAEAGTDAGPDAGFDASMDSSTECTPLRPPERGSEPDDGIDMGEVMFAMRDMVLAQGDDWARTGYDLDGLCSDAPDPTVECLAPAGDSVPALDGENGIDNGLGRDVLPLIFLLRPDWDGLPQALMVQGRNTVLVRITGWNGLDDDSRVDVVISQSFYARPGLPDGGGFIADAGPLPDGAVLDELLWPPPRWDGEDWFFAAEDGFLDGREDQPLLHDDNAYVADGTVVMRIPDRQGIVFNGRDFAIVVRITGGIFTFRMSPDHARVEEAIVAGRWGVLDALSSFQYTQICRGSAEYDRAERLFELAADVRSSPGTGGPGALCDALSIGLRFSGFRGHWGGVVPSLPLPNGCLDGGVPP